MSVNSQLQSRSPGRKRLPQFYCVRDIAEMFGVTRNTVRRWISAGELKTFKVNGQNYVTAETLNALTAGRSK